MKKKKGISLVLIVLIVVGIIILGGKLLNRKDGKNKLANLYEELNASQTYLFEMEQSDKNKTIMAQKGDQTIIDEYSNDNHTTTIVKNNNTYFILHNREEYYFYEQNNVEQNILIDGIGEVVQKDFITGTDKVKGKKYDYEEYNGSTMFMISNTVETNEEDIKTRFYFDKEDNLVYIQTIKGAKQELLKVNIQKEVDDSIFEIPSNYAEN